MDKTRRTLTSRLDSANGTERPGVAVIGIGAVGSSLVRSLYRSGYRLLALISRKTEPAATLASSAGGPLVAASARDVPAEANLVFICTREDAIAGVVGDLLESDVDPQHAVIAHVSGRQTSAVLSPLAKRGAGTMSFHPLGSFPPGVSEKTFKGLTIGLEGDPMSVAVGRAVARDLGAQPIEVPASAKAAYHLAASLTSNYLVTLLADVRHVLDAEGLPPRLTQSLAADTLLNLGSMTPETALTGPIVRADADGLRSQIETLGSLAPELLDRYRVLAAAAIDLADRSGRISMEESSKLRRILQEGGAP